MDTPDQSVIICLPVGDRRALIVPGSTKVPCPRCAQEVWLSPKTRASLPDAVVICISCFPAMRDEVADGEPIEVYVTPESLREARETLINRGRRN